MVEKVVVLVVERLSGRWCRIVVVRFSLLESTGQYEAFANKAVSKRSGQPKTRQKRRQSELTARSRE